MKSMLFVPAKEQMLKKINSMNADAYILDLEDSIEDAEKENALHNIENFLRESAFHDRFFVRINEGMAERELKRLDAFPQVGVMLPKFERLNQYADYKVILENHKVIALIETPMGIANVQEIVSTPWVNAIAFGAEDYTSLVNMKNDSQYLVYQKSLLVTYAKAYGKPVYDTPSFYIKEEEFLKKDIMMAIDMGFDGKMAIHPMQVEMINESLGYNNIEAMQEIVKEYEKVGKAVSVINGKVYERMHIDRMKKIIQTYKEE